MGKYDIVFHFHGMIEASLDFDDEVMNVIQAY